MSITENQNSADSENRVSIVAQLTSDPDFKNSIRLAGLESKVCINGFTHEFEGLVTSAHLPRLLLLLLYWKRSKNSDFSVSISDQDTWKKFGDLLRTGAEPHWLIEFFGSKELLRFLFSRTAGELRVSDALSRENVEIRVLDVANKELQNGELISKLESLAGIQNSSASHQYAVLTGDLVGSTHLTLDKLNEIREQLLNAIVEFKGWFAEQTSTVVGEGEFFRGDSWQVLVSNPAYSLRLALYVRAKMISNECDSRIAIGIGGVDQVSDSRVSLSTGRAFIRSGHALDGIERSAKLVISLPTSNQSLATWLPVVFVFCDAIASGWSARQAEVVTHALNLKDYTQDDIAELLVPPVKRQVVQKTLHAANWQAIENAIFRFERFDWQGLQDVG